MSYNRCFFIGHVGDAPQPRTRSDGTRFTQFNLGISMVHGSKEQRTTETLWVTAIAWGRLADEAEKNVRKGDLLLIDGKLQPRTFSDKRCHLGCKRTALEISLSGMQILDKRAEKSTAPDTEDLLA